jgi:nicotinamide mononucleotide transporter
LFGVHFTLPKCKGSPTRSRTRDAFPTICDEVTVSITGFFSHENILFAAWGYQMSYLELFATLLSLCSVWLAARNHILNWPVGNVAVVLFAVLFLQVQLYSDFIEQIYYFVTGALGWWVWWNGRRVNGDAAKQGLEITRTSNRFNLIGGVAISLGTILMGFCMVNVHHYLPRVFSKPAAFPYLDAFTTMMSFAANLLMVYRKFECWYLWIAVDILGVSIYFARGIMLVSLLYLIFLALAIQGYLRWRGEWEEFHAGEPGLSLS